MSNYSDERHPRIIPSFPELINSCTAASRSQIKPWSNYPLRTLGFERPVWSNSLPDLSTIPKLVTKFESGGVCTAEILNPLKTNSQSISHRNLILKPPNTQSQSNNNVKLMQNFHYPMNITKNRIKLKTKLDESLRIKTSNEGGMGLNDSETAMKSDHGILSFTVRPTGAQNHDNKLIENFPHHLNKELSTKNYLTCRHCGSTKTPEWRSGPKGNRTLCNACGLFYSKLVKRCGRSVAYKKFLDRKKRGKANDRRITSFD